MRILCELLGSRRWAKAKSVQPPELVQEEGGNCTGIRIQQH
jgi:hypothetical protein